MGTYLYDMDNPLIYNNEMGRYKTERQLTFIRGFLRCPSMSVIDIGGGSGRLAIPLSQWSHKVTVVDVSEEALRLLRDRVGDRIEVIHGDIMSLDQGKQFDVALAIDMLKYLRTESFADVFARIHRHVKVGGLLLIAEINKNSWRYRISQLLGRMKYHVESLEGYRDALVSAGFSVEAVQGYVWIPLPVSSKSRFVSVFKIVEDVLQLSRWKSQSPWLLIAARKTSQGKGGDRESQPEMNAEREVEQGIKEGI